VAVDDGRDDTADDVPVIVAVLDDDGDGGDGDCDEDGTARCDGVDCVW